VSGFAIDIFGFAVTEYGPDRNALGVARLAAMSTGQPKSGRAKSTAIATLMMGRFDSSGFGRPWSKGTFERSTGRSTHSEAAADCGEFQQAPGMYESERSGGSTAVGAGGLACDSGTSDTPR